MSSWMPDPNVMCIDVFTLDWSEYSHLLSSAISKAFRKVEMAKILIVLNWPIQTWLQILKLI